MLNIKRAVLMLLCGAGVLYSVSFIFAFLLYFLPDIIKNPQSAGIFILAWPFTLGLLFFFLISITVAIQSYRSVSKIDKISNLSSNTNFIPVIKMSPIIKFGIIFFGLFTLLAIVISIFGA